MRFSPSFPSRHEGAQPAEEPGPQDCSTPPPYPPALLNRIPGWWTPQWETPEVVPPAGESSPFGSGGETSLVAWEALLEHLPPLGVSPTPLPSAALTTESREASAKEWSESEGATSGVSSPVPPPKTDSPQQKKKKRFMFSSKQRQTLERVFQNKNYLEVSERRQLAALLGLTNKRVKIWFQNRRMKFKKERPCQEQHFVPSAPFLSYDPSILPNFSQDFSMYPQQNVLPFMPDSGLPSSSHCPPCQSPLNPPYPLPAPGLPCHFLPELTMHPTVPSELDCMPPPPPAKVPQGSVPEDIVLI